MTALITATELKEIIDHADVKIFDATFPRQSAEPLRIPGAQIFDIDNIADTNAPLNHTLPSADIFEYKMQNLGLNADDTVIVYDQKGVFMAASRAWWMLRVFGHDNVKVLNGGLPQWLAHGYEIEPMIETHPPKGDFKADFKPHLVRSKSDVLANIDQQDFHVIDARTNDRFVHDGHIPGSSSLFFGGFINPETGLIRNTDEIEAYWNASGIDPSHSLTASCGSGVTACVDALALFEIGKKDVAVYDGSWTEWSSDPDTPKA